MKSQLRLFLVAFLVLGLYGCGLKGPLFFPPAPKAAAKPVETHKLTASDTSAQSPVQTASPGNDAPHSADSVVP